VSGISVYSTGDNLKAYVSVPEDEKDFYPSVDALKQALYDQGVVFGINENALACMVSEKACNKKVLVAEGKSPERGVDGRLELLVDVTGVGKPKELADGRVDHKELKKVINVKKGDALMRRIPPVAGKDGITVFGKSIVSPAPLDVALRVNDGTEIAGQDPNLLIAAIDGAVKITAKGDIEVRTTKVITGDIDYSTGNISFSGDLKVNGMIRAGFSIQADGNLYVGGNVEESDVTSSGNMEIIGGAVGAGKGRLVCGGTLKIHHIENFSVKAGKSILVHDTILHSFIKTQERLEAKTIIGGEIESSHGVTADTIGSTAETRTVIKISSTFILLQQKELFLNKYKELNTAFQADKDLIFATVRDGMDAQGKLTEANVAEIGAVKEKVRKIRVQLTDLQNKIGELDKKIQDAPNPVVTVKSLFPNTIFRFGLAEKIIKERLVNVIIQAQENKIIINRQ